MKTRALVVETETSTFMYGADRGAAEFRPPALKGAMRYWFRALAGACMGLEELREAEAEVFGSADSAVGQRLVVRLAPQVSGTRRSPLLPHKSGREASESATIETGRRVTIMLSAVGSATKLSGDQRLDLASWSLWLAIQLGGFGQRARRGAGSLRLLEVRPPWQALPTLEETGLQDRRMLVETGLSAGTASVRAAFPGFSRRRTTDTSFPVLAEETARVVVGKLAARNELDARKKVMELREEVDPSHTNQAFGGIRPRRASPVHVHLERDGSSSFIAVVTWFREPRIGQGELVGKFLDKVKGSDGQEVRLP